MIMRPMEILEGLKYKVCVDKWFVGSPRYEALKYHVPACDLWAIKQRHIAPMGERFRKFGIKTLVGAKWTSWEFQTHNCTAILESLESYNKQSGYHVTTMKPDPRYQDHVEYVGDLSELQEAFWYLDLVQ